LRRNAALRSGNLPFPLSQRDFSCTRKARRVTDVFKFCWRTIPNSAFSRITLTQFGEKLGAEQNGQNHTAFRVDVEGESRDLHPVLRDEVYRIACEAIRNAFHHSGASRIEVDIRYGERQFRVRIRDNGKGIEAQVLNAGGRVGHYGLPGMQERAKSVGAKLAVWTKPDSGTEAELTIPASRAYAKSRTARRSIFLRKGA